MYFSFFDPNNPEVEASAMQSEYVKSDQFFLDLRMQWSNSSDFGSKSDDLGRQISNRKMAWSLYSSCYPRQQAAVDRTIDELDGDTAGSHLTCSRRAARPSVARLQSAGADSGLETKRNELGAHLSVDTCSKTIAPAPATVSHIVKCKTLRQVDSK